MDKNFCQQMQAALLFSSVPPPLKPDQGNQRAYLLRRLIQRVRSRMLPPAWPAPTREPKRRITAFNRGLNRFYQRFAVIPFAWSHFAAVGCHGHGERVADSDDGGALRHKAGLLLPRALPQG